MFRLFKVVEHCCRVSGLGFNIYKNNRFISINSCNKMVKYLNQSEATNIDKSLFEKYKYSVDQLMELAGQSCAIAISKCYPIDDNSRGSKSKSILVICGPGNNGGDGLVCSRHLKQFGYEPEIYYPKKTNKQLYKNLEHQCTKNGIEFFDDISSFELRTNYILIVDALFGFSFKPPVREDFLKIMNFLYNTDVPICSVDIPSGWDVEAGPPKMGNVIKPEMLISLTAPKLCANYFQGKFHYLGGRFVPKKLELEYQLNLPLYPGTDLVVNLK